ncbi:MAG: CDP-alcohol phosphatidyltransferase family protein [Deltaproteobacteria bacterium]|nr:CDP-alcohol phosphatidyltransferase family protein [Deltaproteobacteria bacterium]
MVGERPVNAIVGLLSSQGVKPNMLTLVGLLLNVVAGVFLAMGFFLIAGILMIGAGACDLLDGRVARASQRVTKFGAFLDSVIDRYSDVVLFLGIAIHYLLQGDFGLLIVTLVGMIGSFMVSYTRARAENVVPSCKVGFLERPERVILLIVGALLDLMPPVLWMLAILSHYTAAHRVYFVSQELKALESAGPEAAAGSHFSKKLLSLFFYELERGSWQYILACVVVCFILFLHLGIL